MGGFMENGSVHEVFRINGLEKRLNSTSFFEKRLQFHALSHTLKYGSKTGDFRGAPWQTLFL